MQKPRRETTASLFSAAPLPVAALDHRGRIACLRLIRTENVGPTTFRDLVNHFGGAEAALAALPDLARRGGRTRPIRLPSAADAERELDAAARAGVEPVFTIEPGYPPALAAIDVPPPLVYVRGRRELLARPIVAIVGSRQASAAGQSLARSIAHDLGAAGFVVASGLARGIDAAAHEAALATGTVAVVAGGLDVVYPPEHARLQAQIGTEGCLVGERPPGVVPRAADFPRRNRLISGVSLAIVVVEAARRSGTLITARLAAEQGREVFAVPGHPLDPRAEGTNHLLKQGATLATCAADVIEVLTPQVGGLRDQGRAMYADSTPKLSRTAATAPAEVAVSPPLSLGDPERDTIIAALGPAPVAIDVLARATGLPIRAVAMALVELDLAGRVVRHGDGLVSLALPEHR